MGLFTSTALYNYQPIVSSLADPFLKAWYDVGNSGSYTSGSTTLLDLSGNGNTLFISNSAITYNSVTGSLFFPNNVANYIGSDALTGLDPAFGSASIEVWFRLDSSVSNSGGYIWLSSFGDSANTPSSNSGSMRTFFGDAGFGNALSANYGQGSDTAYYLPFGQTISYNKTNSKGVWRQLVITKEFNTFRMYVDGAFTNSKTGFASQSIFRPNKLVIGRAENGTLPWYGDFSIYKQWNGKALSATEISASYAANRARFGK